MVGGSGRLSRGLCPRVGAGPRLSKGLHVGDCSGLCEAVGNCSELVTVYPFSGENTRP